MNSEKINNMRYANFTSYLDESPKKYATLSRYRKILSVEPNKTKLNRRKLKHVESLMKVILDNGLITTRRKSGTGERKEINLIYKDTPVNKRLGRVGNSYTKVVIEGGDVTEHTRTKMRRRKRRQRDVQANGKRNAWIEAIEQAKQELNAPKFIIIRKEVKDESDPNQVLGHEIYKRAIILKDERKAADALEKENQVVDEPKSEEETKTDDVMDTSEDN